MARFVAIDPGKHKLGWAMCADGEWSAGSIEDWCWPDVGELFASLWCLSDSERVAFICEGQYYRRNVKVFGGLCALRGGLEALAEWEGFDVYEAVQPSVWKGELLADYLPLGYKAMTTRQRYECSHAASIVRAEEVSGLDLAGEHDMADAVNMADWLRMEVEADEQG